MIVGNLFQQAYTIVDSAIVGHYNGEAALAAVGASSALTTIFICVAIGGGIGASVIISQHFGAKRFARMKAEKLKPEELYAWGERAREKKAECEAGRLSPEDYAAWLRES